ncbi:hypothetical protein [Flavobacterium piscinae]|uniref:hypothetical protein n=1 Tax=Flavobacterium piscinae TaxID=2506424 RepID=UPI002AAA8893|nr:hypothetical protein [Flavobacterium piscinae]
MKDNIFSPLQMKNTLVYRSRYAPQKIDNYALGYVQDSVVKKYSQTVLENHFTPTTSMGLWAMVWSTPPLVIYCFGIERYILTN